MSIKYAFVLCDSTEFLETSRVLLALNPCIKAFMRIQRGQSTNFPPIKLSQFRSNNQKQQLKMLEPPAVIMKLLGIFLFWRKNTLPSILFKCAFWAVLAWLFVGIFTNVRTALIAGAAAALVAGTRYAMQVRTKNAKLLKMVDGDKEKLGQLKKKMRAKGAAGALMNEMLLAAADEADDDDEDYEEPEELSDEQKELNLKETKKLVATMKSLCLDGGYRNEEECDDAVAELMESFEDEYTVPDTEELVSAFLPDNVLNIYCEDYCNDDDHAGLMEMFAEATNGKWVPGECHSTFDEASEQWVLTHQVDGKNKAWKFKQSGDWLNDKFLRALIAYTEERSGHTITILNSEDMVDAVCLPPEIHKALIGDADSEAEQQAA